MGFPGTDQEEYVRRIQQYMNKAVHEAKVNLSWLNQNPEYIAALEEFVATIALPVQKGAPILLCKTLKASRRRSRISVPSIR